MFTAVNVINDQDVIMLKLDFVIIVVNRLLGNHANISVSVSSTTQLI